ncbi:hypothetical protein P22_0675 [Propionispora sp. 2/2-37]|uniref:hypothetical protein n=1 Tax=Propionispora sp. 2/2-37 TaxID=1677858 RepID=UPI0006BB8082|nr:hypothetical protein [Propionispora sp. 2/2-37]CUH94609.1 hypothetical protein P22_0675 [Propionispora sp. 2/2-37]
MAKIKRNLSDADMLKGWQEEVSFENDIYNEQANPRNVSRQAKEKRDGKPFHSSFLTPELEEKIGRALLELKLELYKQGVVDFNIKVSRSGGQVILSAVPQKAKQV